MVSWFRIATTHFNIIYMISKLCCIFNTPSHYRRYIYMRLDEMYDCDWYFEKCESNIKEFDTSALSHVERLKTYKLGPFYGVRGMLSLLRCKKYTKYVMMGHSRNVSTMAFLLLKRLFYKNKRVFLWTHGFYGKESFFEKLWKKILLKSADGLLIYGDYACRIMVDKYGFSSEKLFPIHNSLDYDVQLKLRNELSPSSIYLNHFGNNNPTIIFIGRLTYVKKLDMLVQALSDLKGKGKEYNLVLIGDGAARESLEKKADSLNVKNQIWFYGACYDEKTNAELVYNADICVAPGNIGLTSIHALMFGCPAISHDDFSHQMPEFEAIKELATGLFFERDNQESLNDAITNWFSRSDYNRDTIRKACYDEIDANWNPDYQMRIINKVVE